jgi:Protein of unknown function (DUF5818)
MPRGRRKELTGILLDSGGVYPVLRVLDGGEWRLEVPMRWRHLLGKQVAVSGLRDGFDILAVDRIAAL